MLSPSKFVIIGTTSSNIDDKSFNISSFLALVDNGVAEDDKMLKLKRDLTSLGKVELRPEEEGAGAGGSEVLGRRRIGAGDRVPVGDKSRGGVRWSPCR